MNEYRIYELVPTSEMLKGKILALITLVRLIGAYTS